MTAAISVKFTFMNFNMITEHELTIFNGLTGGQALITRSQDPDGVIQIQQDSDIITVEHHGVLTTWFHGIAQRCSSGYMLVAYGHGFLKLPELNANLHLKWEYTRGEGRLYQAWTGWEPL